MKPINFLYWFIAGAVGVILGHEIMLGLLYSIKFIDIAPFNFEATKPFGVPAVISACFWAGLWAIVYGVSENKLISLLKNRWLTAFVFGFFPASVFLFIVLPLKGIPFAAGGNINVILTVIIVNIAWAFIVSLFLWKNPFKSQSSVEN